MLGEIIYGCGEVQAFECGQVVGWWIVECPSGWLVGARQTRLGFIIVESWCMCCEVAHGVGCLTVLGLMLLAYGL